MAQTISWDRGKNQHESVGLRSRIQTVSINVSITWALNKRIIVN